MTPTQQASFTAAVIEECGGDSSKVCMSYSSADRARRSIGGKIVKSVKELWMPPKVAALHWDSKKMKSLTNHYVTEERMAVLVGDSTDVKFSLSDRLSPFPIIQREVTDVLGRLSVSILWNW